MAARPKGTKPIRTLTAKQIKDLPDLAGRLTRSQLASHFGMCSNTLVRICRENPKINEAYESGRAKTIENVASVLIKRALAGDVNAAKFFLERQAGWTQTSVVKQETKKVKKFSDMYDDQDREDEEGDD